MSELLVHNMKLFARENVVYMEPQVGVFGYRDVSGAPLSPHRVYELYRERLDRDDARETGVAIRFLLTVLRFAPDATSQVGRAFAFIDQHRDLWRGINMAGREDNERGNPSRFTEVYDDALRRYPGIGISIHAGEENEPSRHIFDTLRLGVTRIGHGVNLYQDAETMQLMRCGRFLVEINLVSNHLLGYGPSDLSKDPFPVYLRHGIPCCLCTDDRGMWHSNMTDEFYFAVSRFNLSWEEIVRMGRQSLEFSFAPRGLKARMRQTFDARTARFEKDYVDGDWTRRVRQVPATTYDYGKRHLGLKL